VAKLRSQAAKHSDPTLLQLDSQLCFALHSTSRLVIRKYHAVLEELGLTYPQYLVMLVLWEWEDTSYATPNYLALGKRLDLDSGTLTPLLNRMEASGLITRKTPAHDKRERYIKLTRTGRALKRRARQVPIALLGDTPVSLEEVSKLRDALFQFRSALAPESGPTVGKTPITVRGMFRRPVWRRRGPHDLG
jgi:MarR family transcriptional regulator, organic hydroperoxide resistance regulator